MSKGFLLLLSTIPKLEIDPTFVICMNLGVLRVRKNYVQLSSPEIINVATTQEAVKALWIYLCYLCAEIQLINGFSDYL